jgi:hypothetical protein
MAYNGATFIGGNMNSKKCFGGAAIAVAFSLCVMALGISQGVKIVWKPKVGDAMKYRLNITVTGDPSMGFNKLEVGITVTEKVKEIKEDGKVVQESTQSEFALKMDGQDLGAGVDVPSTTVVTTFYPDGRLFSMEGSEGMGTPPRIAEATLFIYPGPDKEFRPGESWTHKRAGDAQRGTRAAEATFTYLATEKVGQWEAHKVSFKYRETEGENPMEVTGTVWLAVDNGYAVKGEYEMSNVEFAPGMPPAKASVKMTRVE